MNARALNAGFSIRERRAVGGVALVVKMDRVTPELARLSDAPKFDTGNLCVRSRAHDHDVSTEALRFP